MTVESGHSLNSGVWIRSLENQCQQVPVVVNVQGAAAVALYDHGRGLAGIVVETGVIFASVRSCGSCRAFSRAVASDSFRKIIGFGAVGKVFIVVDRLLPENDRVRRICVFRPDSVEGYAAAYCIAEAVSRSSLSQRPVAEGIARAGRRRRFLCYIGRRHKLGLNIGALLARYEVDIVALFNFGPKLLIGCADGVTCAHGTARQILVCIPAGDGVRGTDRQLYVSGADLLSRRSRLGPENIASRGACAVHKEDIVNLLKARRCRNCLRLCDSYRIRWAEQKLLASDKPAGKTMTFFFRRLRLGKVFAVFDDLRIDRFSVRHECVGASIYRRIDYALNAEAFGVIRGDKPCQHIDWHYAQKHYKCERQSYYFSKLNFHYLYPPEVNSFCRSNSKVLKTAKTAGLSSGRVLFGLNDIHRHPEQPFKVLQVYYECI